LASAICDAVKVKAGAMRLSDNRYSRDLKCLRLAWRMVILGARTPTICRWTGFSVFRVRRLRHAYVAESLPIGPLKGLTPSQARFFSETVARRCETAVLAGIFRACGVLPSPGVELQERALRSLARGEALCNAFEGFSRICSGSRISFEHAVLLLEELVRGVEIRIDSCHKCHGLVVHDCLSPRKPTCGVCAYGTHRARAYFERLRDMQQQPSGGEAVDNVPEDDRQGRLF
jgi:hypothetical protein